MTGLFEASNRVAARFRLFRLLIGANHKDLAVVLKLSASVIREVEAGDTVPNSQLFNQLNQKYGLSFSWLYIGKGNMFECKGPLTPLPVYITSNFYGLDKAETDIKSVAEINYCMHMDIGFREHVIRAAVNYYEMKQKMVIFKYDTKALPTDETISPYSYKYLLARKKNEERIGLKVKTLSNPFLFGIGAAHIIEESTNPPFYHLAVYDLKIDKILYYQTSPSIKELNANFISKYGEHCSVGEFPIWPRGKRPYKRRIEQVLTDAAKALSVALFDDYSPGEG